MLERSGPLGAPAAVETPPDGKVYPTKFSDLNSYFQALQTRLGITIAIIALSITAAGAASEFLPSRPPGTEPWLVYAAAAAFFLTLLIAGGALAVPGELPLLIEERLASRTLASADDVEPRLHGAFIKEIKRRHTSLDYAQATLALGLMWLVLYACSVLLVPTIIRFFPPPVDACSALGPSVAACSFNFANWLWILLLFFSVLAGLPFDRRRLRRRFAAAPSPPAF